jgi:hypothetical protein
VLLDPVPPLQLLELPVALARQLLLRDLVGVEQHLALLLPPIRVLVSDLLTKAMIPRCQRAILTLVSLILFCFVNFEGAPASGAFGAPSSTPFGAPASGGALLGSPPATSGFGGATSLFGQSPAPAGAGFGGGFGASAAPGSGGFGTTTSGFGSASTGFGSTANTAPAFGSMSTATTFGAAAPAPSGGIFGVLAPAPSTGFGSTGFGSTTTNVFGAPTPASGVFGKSYYIG